MDYADRGKLRIVYGDVTIGVHGEDFHLIFLIRQEDWSPW